MNNVSILEWNYQIMHKYQIYTYTLIVQYNHHNNVNISM